MTYANLDVVMYSHPKFVAAGPAAVGYWAACLAYIKHQDLNGIIPWTVIGLPLGVGENAARNLAATLIEVGLFAEHQEGYELLRYAKKQESFRVWMSSTLRRAVLARDGNICQLCLRPVDPKDIHIDHIVPVSKRGRTVLSNLQVAHSRCNLSKGARLQ